MKQRIFAIGDIHGMADKLRDLLQRLPLSADDTVIFLGDYINRGPDSKGVLDTLLAFRQEHPNTVFLLGKSRIPAAGIRAYRGERPSAAFAARRCGSHAEVLWRCAGPLAARSFFSACRSISVFLEELQLLHRQDGYLFIHAGVPHGQRPEDCRLDTLLFIRGTFLSDPWQGEETIVFGHTPFETPFVAPHKIGVDTGAV